MGHPRDDGRPIADAEGRSDRLALPKGSNPCRRPIGRGVWGRNGPWRAHGGQYVWMHRQVMVRYTEGRGNAHPAFDAWVGRIDGSEGKECRLDAGKHLLRIAAGRRNAEQLRDGGQPVRRQGGEGHTPLPYCIHCRPYQIGGMVVMVAMRVAVCGRHRSWMSSVVIR